LPPGIVDRNGPIPYEQNSDLDKSRQKFHLSLKKHHKISNIPKFRCEMLENADNIGAERNLG
jgi:hypothetical protein